jgi:hypothetical protein
MGGKMQYVPWLLALATAVWFALMARKAGRSLVQWALTGAVFGLVVSTIVLGLGNATGFPFSNHERTILHIKCTGAAILVIVVFGWVITAGLHRHHLALWKRVIPAPGATPKESPAPQPQPKAQTPKAETAKPPAKRR